MKVLGFFFSLCFLGISAKSFYNLTAVSIDLLKIKGKDDKPFGPPRYSNDEMAMGTSFVYTYLSNHLEPDSSERLFLTVSNPSDGAASITITSPFNGFTTIMRTVPAHQSLPINIVPTNIQADYDNNLLRNYTIDNRSIFVTSNVSVKLVATNQASDGSSEDKFAVLPICQLGFEYIVIADEAPRKNISTVNIFSVIAMEDNTQVRIGYLLINENLSKGQVLTYATDYAVSGFDIKSNKKIAVITGSMCGFGFSNPQHCSHEATMEYPTNDWDTEYPHYKFNYEDASEVMVFFLQDNTSITIDDYTIPVLYSSDQFVIFGINTGIYISADKPIYAMMVGSVNIQSDGAPFLVNLVGKNHMTSGPVVFATGMNSDEGLNMKHFARVITTLDFTGYISVNGYTPNPILYRRMGKSDYYFIDVQVTAGQQVVQTTDAGATFGVIAYGYGFFRSYAFNPGLNLQTDGAC
ncbi:unnamed protein product [Auanema sp. JU1783]|nr:unnamed protein product [Auanema sp. JU1783]